MYTQRELFIENLNKELDKDPNISDKQGLRCRLRDRLGGLRVRVKALDIKLDILVWTKPEDGISLQGSTSYEGVFHRFSLGDLEIYSDEVDVGEMVEDLFNLTIEEEWLLRTILGSPVSIVLLSKIFKVARENKDSGVILTLL